jgi:hypothetical protein
MRSNEEGLFEWSSQGLQFCMVKDDKSRVMQIDLSNLQFYYGSSFEEEEMHTAFEKLQKSVMSQYKTQVLQVDEIPRTILHGISNKMELFGRNLRVKVCGFSLDIECERETELEQERNIEIAVEIPARSAIAETNWPVRQFVENEVCPLMRGPKVYNLKTAVDRFISFENDVEARWMNDTNQLWCTENFMRGIDMDCNLNNYLHPVDSVVLLKGGILFISDREADAVLRELWELSRTGLLRHEKSTFMKLTNFTFFRGGNVNVDAAVKSTFRKLTNFSSLRGGNVNVNTAGPFSPLDVTGSTAPLAPHSDSQLVVAHLFNGGTRFPGHWKNILKRLLNREEEKFTATQMAGMRGTERWLDGSDLDYVCAAL